MQHMRKSLVLSLVIGIAMSAVAGETYRGIPDEYQQVEWIKSDGQQIIDTGVVSKKTVSAVLDFNLTANDAGAAIIGHLNDDGRYDWRFSTYNHPGCFFDMGSSRAGMHGDCKASPGVRYTVCMGSEFVDSELRACFDLYRQDGTIVGGHKVASAKATGCDDYGVSYTIFVFGGGMNNREKVSVYSLTINEGDTLLRDMVPAKRKSDGVLGLYDMAGGEFYTNSYTQATSEFTCGDDVRGLLLSATADYDAATDKVNFEFTAISGEADVYVVVTNTATGGPEWSELSRAGAKKGEVWSLAVDGSRIEPGAVVSYRTVIGDAVETKTMPTFTMAPVVTCALNTKRDTNAVLSLTIVTPGDVSPSADAYLAYGLSGSTLSEPVLYKAGCLKGETVEVALTNLLPETEYDYLIEVRNNKNGSCEAVGSVLTLKSIGIPKPDPDPQYTAGGVKFRNVPSAYQQLEYLRSDGNQCVRLGVRSSNLLSAQMDYSPLKNHGGGDIGQNAGSDSNDWRFAPYSDGSFFDLGDSRAIKTPALSPGSRYTIWMGATGGCASFKAYDSNGELYSSATSTSKASASETAEIGVFGHLGAKGTYSCTSIKLWSLLLWQDVEMVRDLVPVKRLSDDQYGLYDFVSGTFLTNAVPDKSFAANLQGPAVPGMGVDATLTYTDCWRLGMTVISGFGDLYATVENAAGEHTKILLKLDAEVGDEVVWSFSGLPAGEFFKIGYLVETKDATTGAALRQYTPIKEVFNGSVTLAAERDADEGEGVIGLFRVALAGGVQTPNDLVVAYTVEPSSTAIAGQTYMALQGTVKIPAGANSATINVLPLWDPQTESDTTVSVRLASGVYDIGTAGAQTILVKSGAAYGGWIYDVAAGMMYDNDWSFTVADLGDQKLKLSSVNTDTAKGPLPAERTNLNFFKPVISTSGQLFAITVIGDSCFSGKIDKGQILGYVIFPEELVEIGNSAFYGLSKWKSELVLPASLRTLKQSAFGSCTSLTIDAAKIPSGLVTIDPLVFNSDIQMTGDLNLPNLVTTDLRQTFTGTGLTSVRFGPNVTGLWGSPNQGPVQNCRSLTNVTFEAEEVFLKSGSCFNGCTSLKEIDLSMVTGDDSGGHFNGSGIEKIIFGDKLQTLSAQAFNGAASLTTVVFTGLPPESLGMPYMTGVAANRKVTTVVRKSKRAIRNGVGKSWLDYTADGKINHLCSTWDPSYLVDGVPVANRPLVTDSPVGGIRMIIK